MQWEVERFEHARTSENIFPNIIQMHQRLEFYH